MNNIKNILRTTHPICRMTAVLEVKMAKAVNPMSRAKIGQILNAKLQKLIEKMSLKMIILEAAEKKEPLLLRKGNYSFKLCL